MVFELLRSFFVNDGDENVSGLGEQDPKISIEQNTQKNGSIRDGDSPIIDVDDAPLGEQDPETSLRSSATEDSDEESQREQQHRTNKKPNESEEEYKHRIWYGEISADEMTDEEKKEWQLPSQITPAEWTYIYVAIAMAVSLLVVSLIHVALPEETPFFAPPVQFMFWFANLGVVPLFWLLLFVWAIPLDQWGWKTNYTRKGTHFTVQVALFVILLAGASDTATETESFNEVMGQLIWSAPVQFWASLPYLSTIRRRVAFFRFGFRSQDRPEDRPYTMFWNAIQISTTLCFQLLMTLYYTNEGKDLFPLIPVLVVGLGDGAAEPVGVRFGKHKYTTYGCCTSQRYTRSLEGSACVFIVSVIAIAVAIADFENPLQVGLAFLLMPISLTLTEAWSFHTLDNVCIYLVAWLELYLISLIK